MEIMFMMNNHIYSLIHHKGHIQQLQWYSITVIKKKRLYIINLSLFYSALYNKSWFKAASEY